MDRSCRSKERNPAGLSCRRGPVPRKGFSVATAELREDCTGGVRKRAIYREGGWQGAPGKEGKKGGRDERGWRKGERGCRHPGGVEWEKLGQGQMVAPERWSDLS